VTDFDRPAKPVSGLADLLKRPSASKRALLLLVSDAEAAMPSIS
jgi:hypothetical protein